ncbi:MAG: hypothetical protein NTV34_06015 [Proteobacteria bacterium]|nr:hypothetical protein [Pseudomonadota bacterium]
MRSFNKQLIFGASLCSPLLLPAYCFGKDFGFGHSFQRELEGVAIQSKTALDLSIVEAQAIPFGLMSGVQVDTVRKVLSDRGLHPTVGLKISRVMQLGGLTLTSLGGAGTSTDYEYLVGGFPICGVGLRTVQHPSGETVMVGSIPQVLHIVTPRESDWPDLNESARVAIQGISAAQGHLASHAKVTNVQKCLFNEQGFLEPVWDFVLSVDTYQYGVQASEHRIYSAMPRYFDVTATVQAYDTNSVTGTLKNYTITVNDDKTMANSFVTTSVYTGEARQTSPTNTFVFTGANVASSEASAFANVNRHLDFVTGKGYVWQGPKPLTVVVYASIKGSVNNALYTPFDGSSGPYIRVGEGDGTTLQNLAFDSDVVSHELGHHVVYQSVTQIGGESLIMHEGLADFLTFSRTGDACLGESICPATTSMSSCRASNSKCLRTGENALVYNDAAYKSLGSSNQAHMQGQLVSGFLWDLRKGGAVPGDTLTSLVMQAITFLPIDATLKNLVAAVLFADSLNSGTYRAAIVTAATARGLDPAALGIDLANLKSSLKGSSTETAEAEKKKNVFGCGAVTGSTKQTENVSGPVYFFLIAIFLFPLAFVPISRRVTVRAALKRSK